MRIVVKRADGGISIIRPTDEGLANPALLERDALAVPGYVSHREYDETVEEPQDRSFRDAWEDNGKLEINIVKARPIHMNYLRRLRAVKLPTLDQAYLRADEAGNATLKQQIAQLKQKLRDIPQTYDLSTAKTPEELKAMIPTELADVVGQVD
jgi:hypothetical protein